MLTVILVIINIPNRSYLHIPDSILGLELWCLRPLSTIFQFADLDIVLSMLILHSFLFRMEVKSPPKKVVCWLCLFEWKCICVGFFLLALGQVRYYHHLGSVIAIIVCKLLEFSLPETKLGRNVHLMFRPRVAQ